MGNTTFNSLSHDLQQLGAGSFKSFSHVHEVLAAAFGYQTFAAYKTSGEEPATYDDAQYVVLDADLVGKRLEQLGYPTAAGVTESAVAAIKQVLDGQLDETVVCASIDDLTDHLTEDAERKIENSDTYISEMTMTNAYGGMFWLAMTPEEEINDPATHWNVRVAGQSQLEQDPERVYHGDAIDVSATITFPKLGRRVLGEKHIHSIGAGIHDDEDDWPDEPDEPPQQDQPNA